MIVTDKVTSNNGLNMEKNLILAKSCAKEHCFRGLRRPSCSGANSPDCKYIGEPNSVLAQYSHGKSVSNIFTHPVNSAIQGSYFYLTSLIQPENRV